MEAFGYTGSYYSSFISSQSLLLSDNIVRSLISSSYFWTHTTFSPCIFQTTPQMSTFSPTPSKRIPEWTTNTNWKSPNNITPNQFYHMKTRRRQWYLTTKYLGLVYDKKLTCQLYTFTLRSRPDKTEMYRTSFILPENNVLGIKTILSRIL